MVSLAGGGLFRREFTREGLSASGGGVGGKTFRLVGGSDCCLLDDRPGLTKLEAANDIASGGRSSLTSSLGAWYANLADGPGRHFQRKEWDLHS